jgi:predicted CXXCH cytochrome family protein
MALHSGPASAAIIFPPDKTSIDGESVRVMIFVEGADPKDISIKPETGAENKATLVPGHQAWDAPLAPGLNVISWKGAKVGVFRTTADRKSPEGFSSQLLHEITDDCSNCHDKPEEASGLKSDVPGLCFECHDDKSKVDGKARKSVHSPVADGDCDSCHNPHFAPQKGLLNAEIPALCLECHGAMNEDSDKQPFAKQHDPVESGSCPDCHDAHAADFVKLVKKDQASLCNDCHDDPTHEGETDLKHIHSPVGDGDCTACHQIHGAKEAGLLEKTSPELCKDCHGGLLLDKDGKESAVVHSPVADGDCLACHRVHASANKKLATRDYETLCLECHSDPRKASKDVDYPVVHPALDGSCTACHLPHASQVPKLLPAAEIDLCWECHSDFRPDFDFLHQPINDGKCLPCHNPHASAGPKLLSGRGNKFCLNCHQQFHEIHRSSLAEATSIEIPDNFPLDKPGANLACRGCHTSHGSAQPRLLKEAQESLCGKCHLALR